MPVQSELKVLKVLDHPVILDKLSNLRDKRSSSGKFRRLMRDITTLMTFEVSRDLRMSSAAIETPLTTFDAPVLAKDNNVIIVSILRAGNGMVDSMLKLIPGARVGHIGLYRDHDTLEAIEYFFKMPPRTEGADLIVLDPMLATANSAIAAVVKLKALRPRSIKVVSILSSPEGIKALHTAHPDVEIFTAAVDSHLNEKGYIVPGLGDAGDRFFGTDV